MSGMGTMGRVNNNNNGTGLLRKATTMATMDISMNQIIIGRNYMEIMKATTMKN